MTTGLPPSPVCWHAADVNNVNAALEKHPELKDLGLVELNQAVGTDTIPADVLTAVRNNGGGGALRPVST